MKSNLKYLLIFFIGIIAIISCNKKKSYSITIEGNNLYITMPYPRVGVSGINKRDWKDFTLNELIEDTFQELKDCSKSGINTVWVCVKLEKPKKDKYGNEEMTYNSQFIAEIPINEVNKYKDYKYFDRSFRISDNINRAIERNKKVLEFPSFR
ncbi:MAG: hypothetical protein J1F67_00030 [Muribaculaceae bacterium]|nr:hypothetical protein [Muribaculaceae bacterium]